MPRHNPSSVRPVHPIARRPRAPEPSPLSDEHPLITLQQRIGNRAMQRVLMRRDAAQPEPDAVKKPSAKESAEQYLRDKITQQDRYIVQGLDGLEGCLLPDERAPRVHVAQQVKKAFLSTGILTDSMLDALYRSIQPVKMPDLVDRQFKRLRGDIAFKDDMIHGLDDPHKWYLDYIDKILSYR